MSLHYILDGYNVIKRSLKFSRKELQCGRAALSKFITSLRPHGSLRNQVTIVFDGKENIGLDGPVQAAPLRVIFAKTRSADEEIKALVKDAKNPACVVVVTDDRELKFSVRAMGCRVMAVEEFLSKPKAERVAGQEKEAEKDISYTAACHINEELSKLWLKPKQKTI